MYHLLPPLHNGQFLFLMAIPCIMRWERSVTIRAPISVDHNYIYHLDVEGDALCTLYFMCYVCQRLMVQGLPGMTRYKGAVDAVYKIFQTEGIRGLYRGFGMTVVSYSPASAVWWGAYGSAQSMIWRYAQDSGFQ
eukprot:Gb_17529 [translate_table: standard]